MRIVHLSDVHVQIDYRAMPLRQMGWRRAVAQLELQTMGRARLYLEAERCLRTIAAEIDALEADHVLLSGDLTCLAVDQEFEGVRRALAPLSSDPRRLSVIPGNHDRYTRGSAVERRFEHHFGHLLKSDLPGYALETGYPCVRLVGEEIAVIGLDSSQVAPLPGIVYGTVGRRQLKALSRLLDDPKLKDRFLCVMVHHAPLNASGVPDSPTHGLRDAKALLSLLGGRPCSVHHGHIHRRYWHEATASRPHLFGAGSSTSLGDEGYWVLEIADRKLVSAEVRRPAR